MAGLDARRPAKLTVARPALEVSAQAAAPAGAPKGPPLTRVHFHGSYSEVQFGESLCVVGGHPSIGDWVPEQGLLLKTNEEIFPSWISTEPVLIETGTVVEYKYVVMGDDGKCRKWEEHTGNRTFTASGADMTVEDDGGNYRNFVDDEEGAEEDGDGLGGQLASLKARSPEVRKLVLERKLAFVKDLEGDAAVAANDTVFMVALSLPVKIIRNENGGWSLEEKAPTDGRNFAMLPLLQEFRRKCKARVICVGWPGVHVDNFRERTEIETLLRKHDCIPVFPPRQDFEKFVSFCTDMLWPIFHDVMISFQSSNPRPFDEQQWAAYQHMNNIFANAVVPHTHESDMIWIHDYHLLMAPTFISRKLVKANIGFYLHTPFPSSDSFKALPIREELLSGMMCADQLGFQFFAYTRNFLVSVKRIFGIDPTFKAGGFMGLEYNGRHVMIKVAHFAYPFEDTKQVVCSDVVEKKAAQVKALFKGKIVFASMDRCDNLSGLVPKFRAFKRFLKTHSAYKGKAVLVQYTFESASGYESTSSLLQALQEKADADLQPDQNGDLRISMKEGRKSLDECDIYLRIEKVDRTDVLALFRSADVLLDTSVKAGLNLMPFEFITARHDDKAAHSVAIVSEFSGCSRVLLGSIRINPWNIAELVTACERALKMGDHERREMNECNLLYVSRSSAVEWFTDFLTDLKRARKKEGIRLEIIGFGAKIRHVCMGQNFHKLPTEAVLAAYRNAKNRVLFLDNEGTLAADKRNLYREYGAPKGDVSDLKSHGTAPDEQVLGCLRSLCQDPRNTVVILSGRNQQMLEDWFGSVPKIGLAAERGFYYRLPMTGDQWHCMKQNPDYTWQSYAFEIMRQFVKRTQGSFIESKGSALVWQYRDADQHFGSWQAKELSQHLKELLFGFEVDVLDGKGYVEVKLRGINKGVAVSRVLSKVHHTFGEVDFVLCVGDDRSDEDMFEALGQYITTPEEEGSPVHADTSSQLSTTDGEPTSSSDNVSDGDRVAALAHQSEPGLMRKSDTSGSRRLRGANSGPLSAALPSGLRGLRGGSGSLSRGDLSKAGSGAFDGGGGGSAASCQPRYFTCTVGRKPSAAKYYLDDVEEVSELLASLKAQHDKKLIHTAEGREAPPSYHTWSGGDMRRGMRVGSMPALSSLAFGPLGPRGGRAD